MARKKKGSTIGTIIVALLAVSFAYAVLEPILPWIVAGAAVIVVGIIAATILMAVLKSKNKSNFHGDSEQKNRQSNPKLSAVNTNVAIVKREQEIVQDCLRILNSTTDLNVFFSRWDLLIDKLDALAKYNAKIDGVPADIFQGNLWDNENALLNSFLQRSYEKAYRDALKLKTHQGQIKRMQKFFAKFSSTEEQPSVCDGRLMLEQYQLLDKLEKECFERIKTEEMLQ